MNRWLKLLLGMAAVVLLAMLGIATLLLRWVHGDDFRARMEREATAALGVPVRIGALSVDLWPLPAVAIDGLRVDSKPAVTAARVEARPAWAGLLMGRWGLASLRVRDAQLPQEALAALAALAREAPGRPAPAAADAPDTRAWPRRLLVENAVWQSTSGERVTFDAQAGLDGEGLVERVAVQVRAGRHAGAQARLRRDGARWPVEAEVGGGRVEGVFVLQAGPAAGSRTPPHAAASRRLEGRLETRGVEVSALTAPSRKLTGKLQAQTTLRAEFRAWGDLAAALRSDTRFSLRGAAVHGLQLHEAVTRLAPGLLPASGPIQLDSLTGRLVTQGLAARLDPLVARSGAVSAQGAVAIAADGGLAGKVNLELPATGGVVALPLQVGGSLAAPRLTLSRAALLGAAIGTTVAPGVGTGAGAQLGERLGERLGEQARRLFGR